MVRVMLLVLVAACGTHDSLAIEIVANNADVKTVELFVVETDCTNCTGIAPPSSVDLTLGTVHLLDSDKRYTATVANNMATFELQPDAMYKTVPKLAAIGFDANDIPKAYAIDDAGFDVAADLGTKRQYTLISTTIDQAQGTTSATRAADHFIVWRAPGATADLPNPAKQASCFAFEGKNGTNEFFVNPTDPDCDGFTTTECDPDWYDHTIDPTANTDYCLTTADPQQACVIGSRPGCVDGTPTTCTADTARENCLPDAACNCPTPIADGCGVSIIAAKGAYLDCKLPVLTTGTMRYVCENNSTQMNLTPTYPLGCSAAFADLSSLLPLSSSGQFTFSYPTSTGEIDANTSGPGCQLELTPKDFVFTAGFPTTPLILKTLFVLRASTLTAGVLLPVTLTYLPVGDTDCSNATTSHLSCSFVNSSDSVWACAPGTAPLD